MKGSLLLLGLLAAVAAVQASPYDSARRFASRLRANPNMGHPSDALLQRKRSAIQAGPYSSYNGPSYKTPTGGKMLSRVSVNSAALLAEKHQALQKSRRPVEVASAPLLRQKQVAQQTVLHQMPVEVASAPLLRQKQAALRQRGRRVEVNSGPYLKQKQEALHPRGMPVEVASARLLKQKEAALHEVQRPVEVASSAHLRQKQAALQRSQRPVVHTSAQLLEQKKKAVEVQREVEVEGAPLLREKMRAIGGAKSLKQPDVEVTSAALIKQKEKGRLVDVASGQALRRKQDALDKVAEMKKAAELQRLKELGALRIAHPNEMLRPHRNPGKVTYKDQQLKRQAAERKAARRNPNKITPKSRMEARKTRRNPGKVTFKDRIMATLV